MFPIEQRETPREITDHALRWRVISASAVHDVGADAQRPGTFYIGERVVEQQALCGLHGQRCQQQMIRRRLWFHRADYRAREGHIDKIGEAGGDKRGPNRRQREVREHSTTDTARPELLEYGAGFWKRADGRGVFELMQPLTLWAGQPQFIADRIPESRNLTALLGNVPRRAASVLPGEPAGYEVIDRYRKQ